MESRGWHSILLSSADPINEGGEAVKLIKITACFQDFTREFADADIGTKLEAYAIRRATYDSRKFPSRKHVSKAQFEHLLDTHLARFYDYHEG